MTARRKSRLTEDERELVRSDANRIDKDKKLKRLGKRIAMALKSAGHTRAIIDDRRNKSVGPDEKPLVKRRIRRNAKQTSAVMLKCCTIPEIIKTQHGSVRAVYMNQCKCTLCPRCAKLKAAAARRRAISVVDELAKKGHRFSLITVTVPHTKRDSLETVADALLLCCRALTKSEEFKKYVRHYARGVETTKTANGYHVHAHFIVDGLYWPKEDLKDHWIEIVRRACGRRATRNGVDVRGLKDTGKGIMEAIGYPFKVADLKKFSADELVELWRVFKGRHLQQMCKAWGKRAREIEEADDAGAEQLAVAEGIEYVRFSKVLKDVRNRDDGAIEIARQIHDYLMSEGPQATAEALAAYLSKPKTLPKALRHSPSSRFT
ncbi:MAG: protein rep [Planctomycetes bacterium]|nr:protein rep [Planctomycetota bacterium]